MKGTPTMVIKPKIEKVKKTKAVEVEVKAKIDDTPEAPLPSKVKRASKKSAAKTAAPEPLTAITPDKPAKLVRKSRKVVEVELGSALEENKKVKSETHTVASEGTTVKSETATVASEGTTTPQLPPKQWQLYITLGEVTTPEGVKVIELKPSALTEDAIIQSIVDSELRASDLRTKTVFSVKADSALATATYAALLGFSGHRLDIIVGSQIIEAAGVDAAIDAFAATLPARPDDADDQVQVGALHHTLPSLGLHNQIDSTEAARIRYAHRVRFVAKAGATDDVISDTLTSLLIITALRRRNRNERLPWLVSGDEPYVLPTVEVKTDSSEKLAGELETVTAADGSPEVKAPRPIAEKGSVGLDLEGLRRRAEHIRGAQRADNRGEIVERLEPTSRSLRLTQAAGLPIEQAIAKLGLAIDLEKGDFFCQNPRHRQQHGQNPIATLHISKSKAQCHICDPERLDALRLVMSTRAITPDEAADLLLK